MKTNYNICQTIIQQTTQTPTSQIQGTELLSGLTPKAQTLAFNLINFARSKGLSFTFISGFRSQQHQKELQERWDRGDRAGLKVRPADNSEHTRGNAFDISADIFTLQQLGSETLRRGGRWGGSFLPPDNNHFDVKG